MTLEYQLYQMYVARTYPVLLNSDPSYKACLFRSGVDPSGLITIANRDNFQREMRMQAWLGAREIEKSKGLEPHTIRTKILAGPQILYRCVNKGATHTGIWWFSEKVAARCRKEADAKGQSRTEWLRNALAVCYNWNDMDGMQRISLHVGEEIPAVLGVGAAKPFNLLSISNKGKVEIPKDYWENLRKTLLGGESQIVLPWIPESRVMPTSFS